MFYVRHAETWVDVESALTVKVWNDVGVAQEPDAVVVSMEDWLGATWPTARRARLLAEHLLWAARRLTTDAEE